MTFNLAPQVVTAIDIVTDIGESVGTHVCLHMSEDVGVTTATKGVEDTTVVQGNMGIAGYYTLESTAIDILTLGHVGMVARSTTSHTRITLVAIQVDVSAVFLIVGVMQDMCRGVVWIR